MSAQVNLKLLPYNYETVITVLQDRRVGLDREMEDVSMGSDEWKALAQAAGKIEDALHDLGSKAR